MGFLRHIIGLIILWVVTALSIAAMPMAPAATSQAEFFPQHEAAVEEHTKVHFTARAPPTTVVNVAITGAAVVEQGNGKIMHVHETHVASLGFGTDFDAPNRTGRGTSADWIQGHNTTTGYNRKNVIVVSVVRVFGTNGGLN